MDDLISRQAVIDMLAQIGHYRGRKMIIAIWIIAICEIVRAVQNLMQLRMLRHDTSARDNAYEEFVKSLKKTDKEFVRQVLDEFERQEGEEHDEMGG